MLSFHKWIEWIAPDALGCQNREPAKIEGFADVDGSRRCRRHGKGGRNPKHFAACGLASNCELGARARQAPAGARTQGSRVDALWRSALQEWGCCIRRSQEGRGR